MVDKYLTRWAAGVAGAGVAAGVATGAGVAGAGAAALGSFAISWSFLRIQLAKVRCSGLRTRQASKETLAV